jgi:DNA-binding NarL/FixJ family response regulator
VTTRVLLADDHAIFVEGLRSLLEKQPDLELVGEAGDGRTAVRLAAELSPNVVIMDLTMPDLNGIEATRMIVAADPATKVVILSMHSTRKFMAEALKAGAAGYLLKESASAELVLAIRTVTSGRAYLSPRVTNTVEAHRAQIMSTLNIHSIAGLTKFAIHEGLTSAEP